MPVPTQQIPATIGIPALGSYNGCLAGSGQQVEKQVSHGNGLEKAGNHLTGLGTWVTSHEAKNDTEDAGQDLGSSTDCHHDVVLPEAFPEEGDHVVARNAQRGGDEPSRLEAHYSQEHVAVVSGRVFGVRTHSWSRCSGGTGAHLIVGPGRNPSCGRGSPQSGPCGQRQLGEGDQEHPTTSQH